jgi:hypothetical protein
MPPRDWCPVCARDCVGDARVPFGLVEQATTVRRGVGASGSTIRLGSIRLDGGGVVLARLDPGVTEGHRVRLADDDEAIVARPV